MLALDRELQKRIEKTAPALLALLALPGCGALSAAQLLGEMGPIEDGCEEPRQALPGGARVALGATT